MDETILKDINEYIDKYLFAPEFWWPKKIFAERSYSRWAAEEILNDVINELQRLPEFLTERIPRTLNDIIDEFIIKMELYRHIQKDSKEKSMFSIAEETAHEIKKYLQNEKEKNYEGT